MVLDLIEDQASHFLVVDSVINFGGVDMSSSAHIDNKKKDILVLGKGPMQGLEHSLFVEKMYSINFTLTKKKFFITMRPIIIFHYKFALQ